MNGCGAHVLVDNAPGVTAFPYAVVDLITAFGDQAALALHVTGSHGMCTTSSSSGSSPVLSPQPALGRVTGRPKASERIQRVVADLDDTIKVIRSTIHALRESDRQTGTALRSRLVGVTDRAAEVLGFAPALRMTGLLDTPYRRSTVHTCSPYWR